MLHTVNITLYRWSARRVSPLVSPPQGCFTFQ